jgi:hypothetical protein
MKPLIEILSSENLAYRCTHGCYNGTSSHPCPACGDANRALGKEAARRNTLLHWKEWAARWENEHPAATIKLIDLSGLTPDPRPKWWD